MRVRVIDLDGSITSQERLIRAFRPEVIDIRPSGPSLRLACRWSRFFRFEQRLDRLIDRDAGPAIHLLGSGDFHHLTLALLRRIDQPFNLLVLDNHSDWAGGVPVLHCGTWLNHAARLHNVRRIFHVGGDRDFDNWARWLAPTDALRSGKIVPLPAVRTFKSGFWKNVPHQPLRARPEAMIDGDRLEDVISPYLDELDRWPLYVSLDKDVLWLPESITNWDAGNLDLQEVREVLQFFLKASSDELVGMDIVGQAQTLDEQIHVLRENWANYDFFFLHFKYTDSTGEDGDFAGKVARIEELDAAMPKITALNPTVLIVTGDHSTPSRLKSHSWHPVPTLLVSDICRPDTCETFGEAQCLRGGLGQFEAKYLMTLALANAERLGKFGA